MKNTFSIAAVLVAVSMFSTVAAQSTLTSTWNAGNLELSNSLSGAPATAPTWVVFGPTLGSTTIGNGLFMLDLDRPFRRIFFGRTDANGDRSRTRTLAMAPMPGRVINFQMVTIDFVPPAPGSGPGTGGPFSNVNFVVSNATTVTF